ncbi:2-oxo-4-hydroxy-4-carboxy-5-ureidoimidazoline decarboxylase [Hymenobacter psoromatis]|uniref:2-oxo-4-hydroxy-4-carboxy-5-ureidoimidazoline decarboxylase n=1 Tax=Hymenobacter psoromatis TaxID=1484116 RepID=UPI001CBA91DA|nr:2-oxo-4-hydroxy-4-carboxy-5-ureidoimidazoline decarboxylase [Hymenobacter psoromatis]
MTSLPDRLVAAVAWLEIAASPTLIGVAAGSLLAPALGGAVGVGTGAAVAGLGLIAGIRLAEKARRQTGTVAFISRIRAYPELRKFSSPMTLPDLNALPSGTRAEVLVTCCGATAWVTTLNQQFPFASAAALYEAAGRTWYNLTEADWREAFLHHPKIGDVGALREKFASTATWAAGEQGAVRKASDDTLAALTAGNAAYEAKFGYIFIVCATGKSAAEMLALLQARLPHKPATEIHIAMGEQAKITRLRLEKLLV